MIIKQFKTEQIWLLLLLPPVPNSLIIDQCLVCNHWKQFEKIMLQLAKITFLFGTLLQYTNLKYFKQVLCFKVCNDIKSYMLTIKCTQPTEYSNFFSWLDQMILPNYCQKRVFETENGFPLDWILNNLFQCFCG